jgi:hypothetical protein
MSLFSKDSGKDDKGKMNGNRTVGKAFQRAFGKIFPTSPGVAIAVALIVGPLGFLIYQCYHSPDVSFYFIIPMPIKVIWPDIYF